VSPRARRRPEDPDREVGIDIVEGLLIDRDRTPHEDQLAVRKYAEDIVQALTAQGWRRWAARSPHAWAEASAGTPATPEAVARHLATARAALPNPRPRRGSEVDGA